MNITPKIAAAAVAALALGSTGAATAFAASHGPSRPHATSTRTGASHAKGSSRCEGDDGNCEQGNDGPGGHADPPGNVDHQFNGVE